MTSLSCYYAVKRSVLTGKRPSVGQAKFSWMKQNPDPNRLSCQSPILKRSDLKLVRTPRYYKQEVIPPGITNFTLYKD